MEKETAIIIFNIIKRNFTADLEVPLDISANDLVNALNSAYDLGIARKSYSVSVHFPLPPIP